MKFMKKLSLSTLEIVASLLLVIYLLVDVSTPNYMKSILKTQMGMIILLVLLVLIGCYANPLVTILVIFAAYEMVRRSLLEGFEEVGSGEDEDGNKISQVKGIRAACKVMKTRYAKPFESVQVKIPYETGMNPYSGLVDLAEATGLLTKQGNRLRFLTSDKQEILQFRKAWERNEDGCLDKVMADFNIIEEVLSTPEAEEVIEVAASAKEETFNEENV